VILAALLLAAFPINLDTTIVNVALPTLVGAMANEATAPDEFPSLNRSLDRT
jgi:hypothetical protein